MGLMMIVIFLVTLLTKVSLGNYGYFNLSDALIMILVTDLSPSYAMLVACIPTVAADYVLGYEVYAIATLVIKAIEGYLVAYLSQKVQKNVVVCLVSSLLVWLGYGLFDGWRFGSISLFWESIRRNAVQIGVCFLIAWLVNKLFKPAKDKLKEWME